jgi:predicted acetyltransferase
MILRELTLKDQAAFEVLLDVWDGAIGFSMVYGLVAGMNFETYLKILNDARDGIYLAEGLVPATSLFAFEGNEIIGKVSVRHKLNKVLETMSGHIGYGVVPEHRQKGYASAMLEQSLPYCRTLGMKKLLITCNEENVASAKVIIKNGGVLENIYDPKDGSSKKMRFWIQL